MPAAALVPASAQAGPPGLLNGFPGSLSMVFPAALAPTSRRLPEPGDVTNELFYPNRRRGEHAAGR